MAKESTIKTLKQLAGRAGVTTVWNSTCERCRTNAMSAQARQAKVSLVTACVTLCTLTQELLADGDVEGQGWQLGLAHRSLPMELPGQPAHDLGAPLL
jgi:hypothetical protein